METLGPHQKILDIYLIQSKTILGEPNMLMDILAWVRFQTPCVMDQMSYGHFGQDQIFYKGHAQKLCPFFSYPQICPQLQKKKKKKSELLISKCCRKEHLAPSQAIQAVRCWPELVPDHTWVVGVSMFVPLCKKGSLGFMAPSKAKRHFSPMVSQEMSYQGFSYKGTAMQTHVGVFLR